MHVRTLLSTVPMALLLVGCSGVRGSTEPNAITAFTDPDYVDRRFNRVAVLVDVRDIEWRKTMERTLTEQLVSYGMNAEQGAMVLPPTRAWTDAERRATLTARGFDAFLLVQADTGGSHERYVEPVTTSTVTRHRSPVDTASKGEETKETEETVTTTKGGYYERTVWTQYRMDLIDVATDRTAWVGFNTIWSDHRTTPGMFCSQIAAQLKRDRRVTIVQW